MIARKPIKQLNNSYETFWLDDGHRFEYAIGACNLWLQGAKE
jgi:hypothetical protein